MESSHCCIEPTKPSATAISYALLPFGPVKPIGPCEPFGPCIDVITVSAP